MSLSLLCFGGLVRQQKIFYYQLKRYGRQAGDENCWLP